MHGFGLAAQLGAPIGATLGGAVSFFLNRRFAFHQHHAPIGPQLVRFIGTSAVAVATHAWFVGYLFHQAHLPLLVAKAAGDLLIFSGVQMFVLRYFVFPRKPVEAAAPLALTPLKPLPGSGSAG